MVESLFDSDVAITRDLADGTRELLDYADELVDVLHCITEECCDTMDLVYTYTSTTNWTLDAQVCSCPVSSELAA